MAPAPRAAAAALAGVLLASAVPARTEGLFSQSGLAGWEPLQFRGKAPTRYSLVTTDGARVLQADCRASASGLIRRERIDLRRTPLLRWRWRTQAVFAGLDERQKAGDDFPLRVYAVRDGGWARWRTRSIVYVWSNGGQQTPRWPSPYTANAQVVALRGPDDAGHWVEEVRDVRADFADAFDVDAADVDGVALMSDCDDSGRSARAWYGDIRWAAR